MRRLVVLMLICWPGIECRQVMAIDPYAGNDPYWVLLHEPAVIKDLKLDRDQGDSYGKLLDELDVRFFPLRNKPDGEATAGMKVILRDVQSDLKRLLRPAQLNRLNEILFQFLGTAALRRDDVREKLRITDPQQKRIFETLDESDAAVAKLYAKANEDSATDSFEKSFRELKTSEQKKILSSMKPDQQAAWRSLVGPAFPVDELRKPAFKVPDFIDTNEWINSPPLQLAKLRGKVVVVHFYACGCINCIHNYPWYRQWHDQFDEKDVVLIGIHSPETTSERDSSYVRRRAADEKLAFPILIDGKSENWNAWGNSMWPSVYVIDKRGYLRDFWAGELKWKGNDGEKYIRERIEKLVEDPKPQEEK